MSFSGLENYNEAVIENNRRPWGSYFVFVLSCLLGIMTIIGPSAALAVYLRHPGQPRIYTAQILLVIASTTSYIFLGFYLMAARRNEAVGLVRPPVRRWHNACFITLRFSLIMWLCATVACFVAAFKQACSTSKYLCILQTLEAGVSISAFVVTIAVISLFEKCDRPFQTPFALKSRPRLVCRVSAFVEDLALERSVSRGSSLDYEKRSMAGDWMRSGSQPQLSCERKPIGNSPHSTLLGFHIGISQRSPLQKQDRSRIINRGRKQRSAENIGNNPYEFHAMSKYTYSNSSLSSGQTLISSSASEPRRAASISSISSVSWADESCASFDSNGARKVSPSSSISDCSHRSPLSIMRTAACPEIPIQPDLRFFPIRRISSAHDLHGPYRPPTLMLQRPRPSVSHHSLRHHSTISVPLSLRKPKLPPRLSSQTSLRPLTASSSLSTLSTASTKVSKSSASSKSKRKTIEIKVPGAFIAPTSQEQALEAHTRMIEDAILASAKSIKMSRHQPRSLDVSKPASAPPQEPPPPLPRHAKKRSDDMGRFGAKSRLERRTESGKHGVEPYVSIVAEKSPSIPALDLDIGRF